MKDLKSEGSQKKIEGEFKNTKLLWLHKRGYKLFSLTQ